MKLITPIKSERFLKRELVLAIAIFAVVFLFLSNFVFAAKTKISQQEAERIKTVLDIVKTTSSFGSVLMDGGNFMKALNTAISGGQTATNITYGLLVLSAINEMEFMDMVLSQDYKDKERAYFNQILDERTKLTSYWKGIGFDIPKVVSGRITSPLSAMALNTFEMTDKAILIFTEFEVLKKGKLYDGLWRYFDERRNGESHQGAWELAEPEIGFAVNSISFRRNTDRVKEKEELEQQFAALYEKWGPYATPYGISKEYKEQLASELRNTLAVAIEENTGVQPRYTKEGSVWEKFSAQLVVQLANIKNAITSITSQVKNPFSAGLITELPSETPTEVLADARPPQVEEWADVGSPPILELVTAETEIAEVEPPTEIQPPTTEPPTTELAPEPPPEPATEKVTAVKVIEVDPPSLCQRGASGAPRQYRVLINEVAWMGSQESPNSEWMELKNIWGLPINLSGWQVQDKEQQIKVIFGENDIIPAQGYFLLERTDDNSLPDAPADKIYTGALSNSDEALYLFDNNCQIEDEIAANPNWPGGDNSLKKTMQRFDTFYWYTGTVSAGRENSSAPSILIHPSAPAPVPKAVASKPNYLKIFITEARAGSPGNEKDDFVELYNPNSEAISLSDWYIQRKTETGQDFSSYAPAGLFSGKTIQSKEYFLIANASSTLASITNIVTTYALTGNNTLVLKNPNGEIADQISTASPPSNKSYGRKWPTAAENYAEHFENQKPTPKARNESGEMGEGGNNGEGGASALSVAINEIAWMGTKAQSQDEWIEFYNNTTSSINLTNWRLAADDGGPDITFSTSTIPSKGYFLIERTDDSTVNNVSADWFGSFGSGLHNSGENLKLYDNLGNLIDSADFSSGWPAGQASLNYISMERINSASSSDVSNWASNNRITRNGLDAGNPANQINGTPKAQNSVSRPFTEIQTSLLTFNDNFNMTLLGSPYIMDGSIKVLSGAKLTIEPGVIIKFKENFYQHSLFTVEGELEAIGVTFTSSSTQPSAGDWDGIYFKQGSVGK